jgi:hypothetical protein
MDKERTQLNRFEDIDNHTWYLCLCWSRVLKLAVYSGRCWCRGWGLWTKQGRFLFLLGGLAIWRREETQLNGAEWFFYATFSTLLKDSDTAYIGEGAPLTRQRTCTWRGAKELKTCCSLDFCLWCYFSDFLIFQIAEVLSYGRRWSGASGGARWVHSSPHCMHSFRFYVMVSIMNCSDFMELKTFSWSMWGFRDIGSSVAGWAWKLGI